MIALIAGQVLGGLVLSHFGWPGFPQQPVSVTNLIGAAIMIGGLLLATRTP